MWFYLNFKLFFTLVSILSVLFGLYPLHVNLSHFIGGNIKLCQHGRRILMELLVLVLEKKGQLGKAYKKLIWIRTL